MCDDLLSSSKIVVLQKISPTKWKNILAFIIVRTDCEGSFYNDTLK